MADLKWRVYNRMLLPRATTWHSRIKNKVCEERIFSQDYSNPKPTFSRTMYLNTFCIVASDLDSSRARAMRSDSVERRSMYRLRCYEVL